MERTAATAEVLSSPRKGQTMTTRQKLDARLATAPPFVRPGAIVADVGTDHAYLPIYLCTEGEVSFAVASDINQGPIESAASHIAASGLTARIQTVRTDGLRGLEAYHPTDILIFGMGGELIARILTDAPWVEADGIRLILQPMTHPECVRRYLAAHGFAVTAEVLSRESGKIYLTLVADYTGAPYAIDEATAAYGRLLDPDHPDPLRVDYLSHRLAVLQAALRGKQSAGAATAADEAAVMRLKAALYPINRKETPL